MSMDWPNVNYLNMFEPVTSWDGSGSRSRPDIPLRWYVNWIRRASVTWALVIRMWGIFKLVLFVGQCPLLILGWVGGSCSICWKEMSRSNHNNSLDMFHKSFTEVSPEESRQNAINAANISSLNHNSSIILTNSTSLEDIMKHGMYVHILRTCLFISYFTIFFFLQN